MGSLLIPIHLKSWQSVISSNNQTVKSCRSVMFLRNIDVKSVNFFYKGTFTRISSSHDERDILK